MKNGILGLFLILGISFSALGQELNQYQYVKVPYKFEFQKEENQYQLNALTAFLFEKYGFSPLYKNGVPFGVDSCEILEANVIDDSGLFTTKVYVILKNCRQEIIFTSKTGVSKEKDYKKAFQEALREAFQSVEALQHKTTPLPAEVIIDPVVNAHAEVSTDSIQDNEVIVDPVVSSEEMAALEDNSENTQPNKDISEEVLLVNGAVVYQLRKTEAGFKLSKGQGKDVFANLVKSSGGDYFLYSSKNVNGVAFFDDNRSLVVEYLDGDSGQMITLVYRRKN